MWVAPSARSLASQIQEIFFRRLAGEVEVVGFPNDENGVTILGALQAVNISMTRFLLAYRSCGVVNLK
jgi:hypothetical protein